MQRFEAEAQLVARLEHPHIVPLYDYWREPGGAYLVFRLLTGGTAEAALVSGGAFDVARVSRIVEEVGSALLAAHTAGVVHCDVKPSNMLFDAFGNSYLTDFGIASTSSIDDDGRSRAYDVPELADRHGDTVQSDIFSFGCMLWELLADESRAVTNMQWQDQPARAESRLPSLAGRIGVPSAAIDAVIARATEPEPAMRFESMAELIVAWRAAVGRDEGVLTPDRPAAWPIHVVESPACGVGAECRDRRRRSIRTRACARSPRRMPKTSSVATTSLVRSAMRSPCAAWSRLSARPARARARWSEPGSCPCCATRARASPRWCRATDRCEALRQALRSICHRRHRFGRRAGVDRCGRRRAARGDLVLVVDQFEECWTLAATTDRERFLGVVARTPSPAASAVSSPSAPTSTTGRCRTSSSANWSPTGRSPLPPLTRRGAGGSGRASGASATASSSTRAWRPRSWPRRRPIRRVCHCSSSRSPSCTSGGATDASRGGHSTTWVASAAPIGRRAEETYRALTPELQAHARELFARLVAPGMGSPDTRRRALGGRTVPTRDAMSPIASYRRGSLVADRDLATREPVVEVAHEALLTNWPRLREWLNDDRRVDRPAPAPRKRGADVERDR